ncbi:MAG: helix-turn-helix domain-containing protein [Parvibaculum sp.]|uniref:TetR/AcrR family transcriptional regulator n=1 Tax=Parvibaculum sp. TaxID=2024848 RepID=UPI0032632278
MVDLKPKKQPKQARSKASFDAIVGAAARLLRERGYEALTTNHIAEQAGVGIATLYEFFPNKEAIVAELTARLMAKVEANMEEAFAEARGLDPWAGVSHMTARAVAAMAAERDVFRVLLRQVPFVPQLPVVVETRAALAALSQRVRIEAADALDLPMPEEDAWLISEMLYNAILEVAFLEVSERKRAELTKELARLTYRMAVGRDPEAG